MSAPETNPLDSISAQELISDLETQLGRMAGEMAATQIRVRRRDQALQERDDEIRYLKSRLPADDDTTPEG